MSDEATAPQPPYRITRRSLLKGAGAMALALAVDAAAIDPQRTVAEDVDLSFERLPWSFDGFRIAQLSDLHYGFTIGDHYLHSAIDICNRFEPDLVVITGDFVTAPAFGGDRMKAANDAAPCAHALKALRSRIGAIAVLGNHDVETNAAIVTRHLAAAGIPTLVNRSLSLMQNQDRIWISGVNDVMFGLQDLNRTVSGLPPDEFVVLLAHEPDFADDVARFPHRIDLQLSGHSHGGQVRFPFIGAPVLPPLAKKYPVGWHRIRDLQLYTNRGLGTIGIPVRFLCPPEVTRITLRRAAPRL